MMRLQSWSFKECEIYPLITITPGLIWLGLLEPVRVSSMGQIELFNDLLRIIIIIIIIISYLKPRSCVQIIYIA